MDQASFVASAATISPRVPLLVPTTVESALLHCTDCGFAVRVSTTGDGSVQRHLLMNAAEDQSTVVQRTIERLQQDSAEAIDVAQGQTDYNAITSSTGAEQVWIDHAGYSNKGRSVASDFRVLPLLSSLLSLAIESHVSFTYQLNADYSPHNRETERQARKYIAAINSESDLPPLVRDMQRMLANRLTSSVYLIDELLAYDSRAALQAGLRLINRHFAETTQKVGFVDPPLQFGSFDDLFVSGIHSSKLFGPQSLIATAAGAMPPDDMRQLLRSRVIGISRAPAIGESKASVAFISYSSSDFARAVRTCEFLENRGLSCWIAPRDIRPGEAYPEAIISALENVRALVVLVSGASNLSPHVHREIERALHHRAVIVPLRVEDMTPTGSMEYLLSTCQWLNGFNGNFDTALDQLYVRLAALKKA
jgi:hypothetical protein